MAGRTPLGLEVLLVFFNSSCNVTYLLSYLPTKLPTNLVQPPERERERETPVKGRSCALNETHFTRVSIISQTGLILDSLDR